ncbi:hypothetical protein GGR50DRAFT_15028 [Xylaria sp. CBS 124048]|nr:hypothetical protein GGR50DRAFT_15028 [Xylaria sp. CBS 124048]
MAQIYRERDIRYTRERSRSDDDDERHYTTTTRYKVGGGSTSTRLERIDRYDDDDDRLSSYTHSRADRHPSAEIVEVDRRVEKSYPERPRSALDASLRTSDAYRGDGERHRTVTVEYDREVERDRDYHHAPERRSHTHTIEESREVLSPTRDHYWERRRPWEEHHGHEIDIHFDKRVISENDEKIKEKRLDIYRDDRRDDTREYKERDLKIERRYVDERRPHDEEIERYRREVEYYAAPEPPQAPIIIRQKMPEQKVIVNEAPAPAPVIVPRADPAVIVLREGSREHRRDDDYYRRHEEKRRDSYDEDFYYKKTVITRDRSSSSDHHKKRHLAEGALAGAGIGALVSRGDYEDHRGRKVLTGAALGALGSEVLRRAKSAYEDRHEEFEYDEYDQERHRSKSRSRLATGLALGAAALAVAGGLKYIQDNKVEKEEAHRGRARRRHSVDEYEYISSRSTSRHGRSRSRSKSKAAKAGAATAAIAGLVHHYRSKSRGKSRSKSRSKSRIKTGAEIAAAGLTGAAATKAWEHHKDKKHHEHREHRGSSDDEYHSRHISISRRRSRSRSLGRHHYPRDLAADKELGLVRAPDVEYGSEPLESLDSSSDGPRRRRHKHKHRSPARSNDGSDRKRSRSRLRDVATAGLGTGVAAIGMKTYSDFQKRKEREEREVWRSRSRGGSPGSSRSRDRHSRVRDGRSRDRERRRGYEDAISGNLRYPEHRDDVPPRSRSPPLASGGFPPESQRLPPAPAGSGGFTIHPNHATTNVSQTYIPYNPQDYVNLPPPPPGPPPASAAYVPPPGGPGYHPGPANVSGVPKSSPNQAHPVAHRSSHDRQGALP